MIPRNDSTETFSIGQRVEAHPCCDCWMQGDRFGTVERIGRRLIHVRMDRFKNVRKFDPSRLLSAD